MKLEDMILVVENHKGTESKFLIGLPEYMEMALKACGDSAMDMADAIQQLYDTRKGGTGCSELYFAGNKSCQAKFCVSKAQLQNFLLNDKENGTIEEKPLFDEERCRPECFEVLKAYGMNADGHDLLSGLYYEAVKHDFHVGEIVDNLNGHSYRVVEVLSPKNVLFMSLKTGELVLGVNTEYFQRTPKDGYSSPDSVIVGVEWGQGKYLGKQVADISYESLRKDYGISPEEETLTQFRNRMKREFRLYTSISESESVEFTVRYASELSLENKFGTNDYDKFCDFLNRGLYDVHFNGITEDDRQKESGQIIQGKAR